jgi:hypothetical protein
MVHRSITKVVYRRLTDTTWSSFRAVSHPSMTTRRTRQTRTWYHEETHVPDAPDILSLVPTIISTNTSQGDYFYSMASSTPFPQDTSTPAPSVWNLDSMSHAFVDTPEFYQRLIGSKPPIDDHIGFKIATGMELETLLSCSDGSFDPLHKTGSHGWILATTDKETLAQGAGPADGNPSLMSSYRTELGGLLAILYMIYRICQQYQVTSGKVSYYCDNKGVISNIFSHRTPSITQFLQTDSDLVMEARHLLTLIPVTILASWVKGHYNGEFREFKHDLNEKVDRLATEFNKKPDYGFSPKRMPCPAPAYAIQLIYDNSLITTKLYKTMASELHRKRIVDRIKQKSQWDDTTFRQVNWDAHETAFTRLSRSQQVMVAKLQHNLVNTNSQNAHFYGKSSMCPCCLLYDETLDHVLSCSSEGSTEHRQKAMSLLEADLVSIKTPVEVISAILHGITMWVRLQTETDLRVYA